MGTYDDLKKESLTLLRPYIETFTLQDLELDSNINSALSPMNSGGLNGLVGYYAITYAILLDDYELAEDLCANGADLNVRDRLQEGKTPLELAIEYGRASLVSLFIKYGAEIKRELVVPSSNPCSNPFRFFWSIGQYAQGKEVNYDEVEDILYNKKSL